MAKTKSGRGISLYDVEQFFREAGAERINENAVKKLKIDLEEEAREILDSALVYANYAGRRSLVKKEDILLTEPSLKLVRHRRLSMVRDHRKRSSSAAQAARSGIPPQVMPAAAVAVQITESALSPKASNMKSISTTHM